MITRLIAPFPGGVATCAALCLAAPLVLPTGAVPVTLQSLIVCLAGALTGGAGVAGVIAWLALAALGLPVLAGMAGGIGAMSGGSTGFLIALPLAARLTMRWHAGWNWRATLLLMLAAHALLLLLGGIGVALRGGDPAALAVLLPGAAIKALAGTALLLAAGRFAAAKTLQASGGKG